MIDNRPEDVNLLVAITRLEAKVDVVLAQHGAELSEHGKDLADHEARVRVLEAKPTIAPRTLWTVTVTALTLITGIITVLIMLL